jgi:membrane protease subunit HflC
LPKKRPQTRPLAAKFPSKRFSCVDPVLKSPRYILSLPNLRKSTVSQPELIEGPIMTKQKKLYLYYFIAFAIIFYSSVFIVHESENALLLRLGKIEADQHGQAVQKMPGLHFKIPLINQVWKFTTRLQTLDIQSSRIVTAEKKDVIVDYYVKWRIRYPALYYTRTSGNVAQAQILLEQQLNDGLRAEFGRRTIREVISDDRTNIMETLNKEANKNAKILGLEVVDVRIKRIDLPAEVSAAIFDRMRAERARIATEHRAQGKSRAEAIRANADGEATVLVAQAKFEAMRARGEGDEQAAAIYAASYNKNPNFYAFYRSLLVYKKCFANKQDILILKPDTPFFKYFNGLPTMTTEKNKAKTAKES